MRCCQGGIQWAQIKHFITLVISLFYKMVLVASNSLILYKMYSRWQLLYASPNNRLKRSRIYLLVCDVFSSCIILNYVCPYNFSWIPCTIGVQHCQLNLKYWQNAARFSLALIGCIGCWRAWRHHSFWYYFAYIWM